MKNYLLNIDDFINEDIKKVGDVWKVYPRKPKKGQKVKKSLGTHRTYKKALAQLRAIEISKNESSILTYTEFINERKLNSQNPAQYKAPEGSARDKKLDRVKALLKAGKKEEAYKLRDSMEKEERENSSWKNTPRKDSKVLESKENNLSADTLKKIKAVADRKGYSFADLKKEYVKGLGAYYSSGSRPGMTAHQWAMARVNAASPSKKWANVKKTKN